MRLLLCCMTVLTGLTTAHYSFAQNNLRGGELSGNVVDDTGLPVISAALIVKGTQHGTMTDLDGLFTLSGLKEGDVIQVSTIGYETEEIVYQNQATITITLHESALALDESVVTALGIKRSEKALSYNVQQIDSEKLTAVKDANFMNSLSGKVAGVQITQSASGTGGPTRVVMRGVKSLTQSNNALYVIDGVPMYNSTSGVNNASGLQELMASGQPTSEGIADINPEDIESISVLNGPAAAALYGSSAANGVVLITTKKGSEGKIKISYTNNTTFSTPVVMYRFQDTYGNRMGSQFSWGDRLSQPSGYSPSDFFQTGVNESNAVTISVGNQHNQTYVSAAATNSTSIIPNSTYNRYNFTVRNTTSFLNDKMTLDFSGSYILQDQLNPVAMGGAFNPVPVVYMWPRGEDFNEVRAYEEWDPSRNLYVQRWNYAGDAFGTGYAENPYWEMYRKRREFTKNRYMFNINWSYNILDWLNVAARVKMDNSISKNENKYNASSKALAVNNILDTGVYQFSNTQEKSLYGDVLVNINKTFTDNFSLSANIGGSFNHQSYEYNSYGGALGMMPNLFTFANVTRATSGAGYDAWRQREYAVFANVELGVMRALYLTLTARNEWSSTLSNTSQLSYFFPSVGVSGVISELVKMPKWLEYLKVRASFADVGSPLQRGLTETYYTWNGSAASTPNYRPITHLYPEKTDSWEVGLTARLLRNFSLDLTLYLSDTKKQTIPVSISAASGGYSTMYIQTGNVRNKGIELAVGYDNTWNGFGWSTNLTYSANQNRITELFGSYYDPVTDRTYYPEDIGIQSGNNPIKVGNSMGDIYTSQDFVRDMEGRIFVNPNGEVSVESIEPRKLGSTLPKGNIGWSNTLSYKGLSLNFLLTARIGGLAVSYTQMFLDRAGVSQQTADARDAGGVWVNHGHVDAQSYYNTVANINSGLIQEYVYDGTNVRLQELSLGYTLPRKWFNDKLGLTLSLIGRNLWMIYCKAPFDPDLSLSTGTYNQSTDFLMMPGQRNMGFSVKVEF